MSGSSAALRPSALPSGLQAFIHKKLCVACGKELNTALLLDGLVGQAPPGVELRGWVHAQASHAFTALEKNGTLAIQLVAGDIGLMDCVAYNRRHRASASKMYDVINGHHGSMRRTANELGNGAKTDDAWRLSTSDAEALSAYAAAATQIGARPWVRLGIDWMVNEATDFVLGETSGNYRLARREAATLSYATRGGPLSPAEERALQVALQSEQRRSRLPIGYGEEPGGDGSSANDAMPSAVRLLDVGSCGTLFDGYPNIAASALDLCPQADNPKVMQCDFLQLAVGAEGSQPILEPSSEVPAGSLKQLPAASFDVVALSLVLSYLPRPAQRGAIIRKARRLLPTPDPAALPSPAEVEGALADEAGVDAAHFREGGFAQPPRRRRGMLLVVDHLGQLPVHRVLRLCPAE